MTDLFSALMAAEMAKKEGDKDAGGEGRLAYDPKGNSHAFNKGFEPAWWAPIQAERNGGKTGVRETFTNNMLDLVSDAGGKWPVFRVKAASQMEDGTFIVNNPPSYNLLRGDNHTTLRTGISGDSPTTPYEKIVCIPDEVGICFNDFLLDESADLTKMSATERESYEREIKFARERSAKVKAFLQKNNVELTDLDKGDVRIPLNKILKPAGCNVWMGGKRMTTQYFVGFAEPRPGDMHKIFFTIETTMDGSKATRFYLTIVRVVCENTQMHAEADGWSKLLNVQKERQRIRRTLNFEANILKWHHSMVDVLIGAVEVLDVFSALASKKISDNKIQRDAMIRAFVADNFGIKADAAGKVSKRSQGRMDEILDAIYADTLGGGKQCETYFDLLNGFTNYKQNRMTVNGLDSLGDKLEKRYMLNLTDDITVKENQAAFVSILARAA